MNKKPAKPKKPEPLRTAAEAELAHAPQAKLKPRPAEELLHELQVHHIELEMQNEQLRQAQIALEESRDRYVDIYEFAPVGYLALTDTGMIGEINLTGAKLLGMERKKLLRRRFSTFVTPEYRERWNSLFTRMLRQDEADNCELAINGGDEKRFYVQLNCKHWEKEGAAPMVRITLTDISLLRQSEEAMREWQRFVECAHWGMTIGRVEDRAIKLVNPAFARMHGYTMEELHGIKADNLYAPESRADIPKIAEILSSAGCYTFECVRLRKDGSTFPAVVDVATIHEANGKSVYVSSVTDITERKRMERKMRGLYTHLQTVREEEKASIAREIHDDLGGTLTALKMESYRLAEELPADEKAAPLLGHIEAMAKLIDNAVHVTRRVITGLRPTILDDFGLMAAIEWYAAQFSKRTGIECRVNCVAGEGCEKKLYRVRSINLFRIFQEALTNVLRHSSASRVEVEFHRDDGGILLSISDNGCGIKEERGGGPIHYGMMGMTERVDQLGGKIKFISPPSGGFRVEVCLPLPANNTKNGDLKKGER